MDNKRPKWVWAIFIFFMFGSITGIYKMYTLSVGITQLPDGINIPQNAIYYVKNIFSLLIMMSATILLFMRKEIAKWLFLTILIYSVLNGVYYYIFPIFPEEYKITLLIGKITSFIIYSLITWYTFKLKEKGYYN